MYVQSPIFTTPVELSRKIWRYMSLPKFLSMLHTKSLHFVTVDQFEDKFEWTVPDSWFNLANQDLIQLEMERDKLQAQFSFTTKQKTEAMEMGHRGSWSAMPENDRPSAEQENILRGMRQGISRSASREGMREGLGHYGWNISRLQQFINVVEKLKDDSSLERQKGFVHCWFSGEHESIAMWDLYSGREGGVAVRSTASRPIDCFSAFPRDVHVGQVEYTDFKNDPRPSWNHLSTYKGPPSSMSKNCEP